MSAAAASANIALGAVYLVFATVLAIELWRNFATFGHSHLGYAFLALALTCGPHHLAHGIHIAEGGQPGTALDAIAAGVGLPIGAIWVALRLEAFGGGRGDRFISGSPGWILAIPTLIGIYFTAYLAAFVARGGFEPARLGPAVTNIALIVTYALIAWYLARTQVANRRPLGGWSLSGLTLSGVFLSCMPMHAGHALLVLDGTYSMDIHLTIIDALAVPAGLYFLWTVEALYRGALPDWNRVGGLTAMQKAAPTAGTGPAARKPTSARASHPGGPWVRERAEALGPLPAAVRDELGHTS